MLTLLTGQIRNTQLYSTLSTDVGRIPGWHLIIGAYDVSSGGDNSRTLTEIDTGITAIIAVNDTQELFWKVIKAYNNTKYTVKIYKHPMMQLEILYEMLLNVPNPKV
mgnify:CR=1 FL=1